MDNLFNNILDFNISATKTFNARNFFNIDLDLDVNIFTEKNSFVPNIDDTYNFDKETTHAILIGFIKNKRVIVQGYHGTGKSTHIEQIAARLNWPCIRINLDSNISRMDLIGKDVIQLKNGKQISAFQEGLLTYAVKNGFAVILDEYDAGRPDVMFVIQRLLEQDGKLTLLENNEVITPHPHFRMFATCNTVGLGDDMGIYHGTTVINQAQLDRWHMTTNLNYLSKEFEKKIILKKLPEYQKADKKLLLDLCIDFTNLVRNAFMKGEISTVISIRTLLAWLENAQIFGSAKKGLELSFLNRCDKSEKDLISEIYQRIFGDEL